MTPFAWRDYLELAERLVAGPLGEAELRSAISRAYYAAYHAAAAFVRASGTLTTGHTHQKVWHALADDADPSRSWLGLLGDQLRRTRAKADYRNPFVGDLTTAAESALTASREIVDAFASSS